MRLVGPLIILALLLVGEATAHEGLHAEIDALTRRLDARPDDHPLRLQRARCLRLHGRHEAALADLASLPPTYHDRVALERGLTHLASEQFAQAEIALRTALAGQPGPRTNAALARAQAGQSCRIQAVESLDRALATRPDLEDYLLRARLLRATGQPAAAADSLADALDRLGPAVLLRRALIDAELDAGRPLRALAHLDEDIARAPDLPVWRLLQARAFDAAGLPAEAASSRDTALRMVDDRLRHRPVPLLRLQRAEILAALGRWREADRELTRLIDDAPRLPGLDALRTRIEEAAPNRKEAEP